jgi:hypothetical protein
MVHAWRYILFLHYCRGQGLVPVPWFRSKKHGLICLQQQCMWHFFYLILFEFFDIYTEITVWIRTCASVWGADKGACWLKCVPVVFCIWRELLFHTACCCCVCVGTCGYKVRRLLDGLLVCAYLWFKSGTSRIYNVWVIPCSLFEVW